MHVGPFPIFKQHKAIRVLNLHRHFPLEESNRERVDVVDPAKSVAVWIRQKERTGRDGLIFQEDFL